MPLVVPPEYSKETEVSRILNLKVRLKKAFTEESPEDRDSLFYPIIMEIDREIEHFQKRLRERRSYLDDVYRHVFPNPYTLELRNINLALLCYGELKGLYEEHCINNPIYESFRSLTN